ncbi:hypothetical protein ACTXT7_007118 [Hymenolepis weldensis]
MQGYTRREDHSLTQEDSGFTPVTQITICSSAKSEMPVGAHPGCGMTKRTVKFWLRKSARIRIFHQESS